MVPVLIVDEIPDALDQYSRSGGLSIDRMPVTHPAAPHFLSILPIDIDIASEEISHTNKLNNKTSDNIYLHMHVPELLSITRNFTQNSIHYLHSQQSHTLTQSTLTGLSQAQRTQANASWPQ